MELNWETAPEDAQWYCRGCGGFYISYDRLRYFFRGRWENFADPTTADYWEREEGLEERPALQEVELPNGLKWPEDKAFQYYNSYAGGFFFSKQGYSLAGADRHFVKWTGLSYQKWQEDAGTIHRYGGKHVPVAEKKVEPPKKKVGWW